MTESKGRAYSNGTGYYWNYTNNYSGHFDSLGEFIGHMNSAHFDQKWNKTAETDSEYARYSASDRDSDNSTTKSSFLQKSWTDDGLRTEWTYSVANSQRSKGQAYEFSQWMVKNWTNPDGLSGCYNHSSVYIGGKRT